MIGTAACLASGRGGCDSQMTALADALGLKAILLDSNTSPGRSDMVLCTGPERVDEAVGLGMEWDVPTIGFGATGARSSMLGLHLTTPQFNACGQSNLVMLDLPLSAHRGRSVPTTGADVEALASLPRPLGLLLVGGPAGPWVMDRGMLYGAITTMSARCASIVVLTSRRTPADLRLALEVRAQHDLLVDRIDGTEIRFAVAMASADEAVVTGDSVSMVSECMQAGLPVGFLELTADPQAVECYVEDRLSDPRLAMPGRLDRFWETLRAKGMSAVPSKATFEDPLPVAVDHARRIVLPRTT